jgi:hypothetical protein
MESSLSRKRLPIPLGGRFFCPAFFYIIWSAFLIFIERRVILRINRFRL